MSRRALPAALAAIGCLALAACSGNSATASTPSGSKTSASAAASSSTSNPTLVALCQRYCAPLQAQQSVCPTGTTNLIACSQPLAQGADQVTALESALNAPGSGLTPDLIRAITEAKAAYSTWSDDTGCGLVYDTGSSDLAQIFPGGKTAIVKCSAEAATVSLTQSSVGLVLRNAARGS